MSNTVTTVPIATADRSKSGYAFVRHPVKLAEITLALVYEKKFEAPVTVVLTDTELLIVGTIDLMRSGPAHYEEKLREIIAQHSAWACVQAVHAVLKDGEAPVLHVRSEVMALDGYKSYGAVVFGWGMKPDGGVTVMAKPEAEFDLGTPFLLRPKLLILEPATA